MNSTKGTYEEQDGTFVYTVTEMYNGNTWDTLSGPETYIVPYDISGNTMTIYVDWDWDGNIDATIILT